MQPFYERAVSNLDRSVHRSLWVSVAHSSFIEGSHMTKKNGLRFPFITLHFLLINGPKKPVFVPHKPFQSSVMYFFNGLTSKAAV